MYTLSIHQRAGPTANSQRTITQTLCSVNGCGLSAISSAGDMAQPSHGNIERCVWESVAIAWENHGESRHYDIDSRAVRAHVSAAGRTGDSSTSSGRSRMGSPLKFIVSVIIWQHSTNETFIKRHRRCLPRHKIP